MAYNSNLTYIYDHLQPIKIKEYDYYSYCKLRNWHTLRFCTNPITFLANSKHKRAVMYCLDKYK